MGRQPHQSPPSRNKTSRNQTSHLVDCSHLNGHDNDFPARLTAQELFLTLPIPPSINHQYATVNGRRILSSKGRQYKATVAQLIISTLTASPLRSVLLANLHTHTLTLSIWFYFTSALRRDLDGGLKIAQDAICNAMAINDNRISELHLYKAIDRDSPRMECTLSIVRSSTLLPPKRKTIMPVSSRSSHLTVSRTRPK